MTNKLVWAAGIAGFFAFGLAAGAVIPSPLLAFVMLVLLLLGMQPRRYSPATRAGRAKLYAAFLVASLAGAIPGVLLPLGITVWLPFGLIGVALLVFTFKVGSAPRRQEE